MSWSSFTLLSAVDSWLADLVTLALGEELEHFLDGNAEDRPFRLKQALSEEAVAATTVPPTAPDTQLQSRPKNKQACQVVLPG
jgi:hypothetical protein